MQALGLGVAEASYGLPVEDDSAGQMRAARLKAVMEEVAC